MDLIERHTAIDAIKNADVIVFYDEETTAEDATEVAIVSTKKSVVASIEELPSTQLEIIRCKDCKYASPNGKYGCKAYHFKLYETHTMYADDYCSRAERREE